MRTRYIRRFRKIYENIDESNVSKRNDLVDRIADQCVVMDECMEHLNAEGAVVPMTQGNYIIDRENPYSKVLDRCMKTYLATLKHLDAMLLEPEEEHNEFLDFIGRKYTG